MFRGGFKMEGLTKREDHWMWHLAIFLFSATMDFAIIEFLPSRIQYKVNESN